MANRSSRSAGNRGGSSTQQPAAARQQQQRQQEAARGNAYNPQLARLRGQLSKARADYAKTAAEIGRAEASIGILQSRNETIGAIRGQLATNITNAVNGRPGIVAQHAKNLAAYDKVIGEISTEIGIHTRPAGSPRVRMGSVLMQSQAKKWEAKFETLPGFTSQERSYSGGNYTNEIWSANDASSLASVLGGMRNTLNTHRTSVQQRDAAYLNAYDARTQAMRNYSTNLQTQLQDNNAAITQIRNSMPTQQSLQNISSQISQLRAQINGL